MEAMTLAEALEATHDYSQLMRENQGRVAESMLRDWIKGDGRFEHEPADSSQLKTAEGFKVAEWHGRELMDMIKRQERIVAGTSQFTEEGRRARAELDAMFDVLMSVAETPQCGRNATVAEAAESKAVADEKE